jgi:lysine-N-methylase
MTIRVPEYFCDFKCIADKCRDSCCIGWEIDIDEETLKKYESLENPYAQDILNSISYEGTPHFKLCAGDRCPHLDKNGLCKIILSAGEEHLCGICREHPRFYNYTDVAEVGLGMSCREAARIILSSPNYGVTEQMVEIAYDGEALSFNGREERERIYKLFGDKSTDYNTKLQTLYSSYKIDAGEDAVWQGIINSLEYLEENHKELFLNYSSQSRPQGMDEYLERALAYFIYRHCTEAYDEEEFRLRLNFCLFCERLLASLIYSQKAGALQEIAVLASIISEEIEYSEDNTQVLTWR